MSTIGRDYITLDVTGRDAEDFDRIRAIKHAIQSAFGERIGYQVLRLETPERIEEELRDPESILKVSGGRLPVILVNLTYDSDELGQSDIAPIESRFALRFVAEVEEFIGMSTLARPAAPTGQRAGENSTSFWTWRPGTPTTS